MRKKSTRFRWKNKEEHQQQQKKTEKGKSEATGGGGGRRVDAEAQKANCMHETR